MLIEMQFCEISNEVAEEPIVAKVAIPWEWAFGMVS